MPDRPLGLYIHAPFCRSKCAYCSFISTTALSLEAPYVKRVVRDIANWGRYLEKPVLDTVYMGGGTPSLLSRRSLEAISRVIRGEFDTSGLLEATIEANPGAMRLEWLKAARREGWDRMSIGVQSLDDALLKRLGRVHDAAKGLAAVRMCVDAGFNRISADLLLGAPGQRLERVLEDASRLVDAGVEHLSIYILDLDKQCPLKSQIDNGLVDLPPDDLVAQTYQALQERLPQLGTLAGPYPQLGTLAKPYPQLGTLAMPYPQLGLMPYEISNYSLPGRHSIHNVRYWQRRPYIGVGPSAAGNIGALRWTEEENITEWLSDSGKTDIQFLSMEESLAEIPLLALRMQDGVNWRALRELAEERGLGGLVKNWEMELFPFIARGLLRREGENLRLTAEGALVSNQVFQVFV